MAIVVSSHPDYRLIKSTALRPPVSDFVRRLQQTNLISIDCLPQISANCHNNPLKFCLVNSRSVRNKTGDIADYIAHDCKPDILAIMESWLDRDDDAVRAQLCPEGYKMEDNVCDMRCSGGIALLYQDFLGVTKVDAGNKNHLNFLSGWLTHRLHINYVLLLSTDLLIQVNTGYL